MMPDTDAVASPADDGAEPITGMEALTRAIRAHVAAARALIETEPDLLVGFHFATDLAELLRDLATDCASLRAAQATRIKADRSLTLEGLGDVLGLSLSRASQLTKAASPTITERERRAP